jgi:putative heme iron utilization protein
MTVDRGRQARALLRSQRSGALATHSTKLPGYPYGSVLPYVTDRAGRPVFLISHLAEHTHNLQADARASVLVVEPGDDVQRAARATLVGDAKQIDDDATIAQRYLRHHPDHAQYLEIGGFHFWTIEPLQIRFIEGFGSLHWIAAQGYLAQAAEIAATEASLLDEMNGDHRASLLALCQREYTVMPTYVEAIGFDCDGFDVRADERMLRFALPETVQTAAQARAALTDIAQRARS